MKYQTKSKLNNEIITIFRKKPLQLIGWGFAIYLAASLIINPFIMIHWQIGFFEIYRNPSLGLLSHFLASVTLLGTAALTTYFYIGQHEFEYNRKKITQQKVKEYVPAPIIKVPEPIIEPELREMTSEANYIKPGVKPEMITIDGEEAEMYKIDDIIFDFQQEPHGILAGRTGSGKSTAMFRLIKILNKQLRYPPTIVLDYGKRDFPDATAYKFEEIIEAFNMIHYIIEGRSNEPQDAVFDPILVVVEESEALLRDAKILLKKEYEPFINRLKNMIVVSRKLNLTFLFIGQNLKATDMPTDIRNNLSQRFYMRLSKTAAKKIFGIPYNVQNLETGLAWYENISAFVKFDYIEKCPPMNVLHWDLLQSMSKSFQHKFKLGELYEGVEV